MFLYRPLENGRWPFQGLRRLFAVPTASFDLHPNATPTATPIREDILKNPGFGRYFTDHMAH
ncbi:Branched-chain-amino-acid aminotransferase [Halomonas chromatireducens]|uniref:Branched-chain-amino-acid aminotransferase n=1 Tax=Halomonas chromatireducens TaxID=507626 RepID=A0A109ULY8_9GAMM|nr:Branched-chain-amino-acid aminotransferase [Halomonas chromatireducens]